LRNSQRSDCVDPTINPTRALLKQSNLPTRNASACAGEVTAQSKAIAPMSPHRTLRTRTSTCYAVMFLKLRAEVPKSLGTSPIGVIPAQPRRWRRPCPRGCRGRSNEAKRSAGRDGSTRAPGITARPIPVTVTGGRWAMHSWRTMRSLWGSGTTRSWRTSGRPLRSLRTARSPLRSLRAEVSGSCQR